MSKEIAGKIFCTAEEAGVTPPTEAEIARARRLFEDFQQQVDAVAQEDRATRVSPKFWDDISGTEYEQAQDS
ncbi:hypothetical protein [Mycobacterium riyadhense]|uniref:hypothetical protein n=1 Tax=Mycobacterium riyadhense TaxID=486698 RepID=UPI00195711A8|nr:hypothetical protein [Mycobacterium riyadhense]